jgi:hypothetical protein
VTCHLYIAIFIFSLSLFLSCLRVLCRYFSTWGV